MTDILILKELDEELRNECTGGVRWLFRIGSSINPDWFTAKSDIDYLIVVDDVSKAFINDFPGRTSPALPDKVGDHNANFYWRLERGVLDGHRVNVTIYSTMKFLAYCHARSPPKIYVLHEHLLLLGDEEELETLRAECPPTEETARMDLQTLKNPRYEKMWPWAWRSVAILKRSPWLKNKREIAAYVHKEYPGRLMDKLFLRETLTKLLREREEP